MDKALELLPAVAAPPKVALIEDQTLLRQALQQTLTQERGWTDIRSFRDAQEGLDHCLQTPPDLLLIDLDLAGRNGWAIAAEVKRHVPQTRILMLAGSTLTRHSMQCLDLGINGYIDKTAPYAHFLQAVDAVMSGALFFSAHIQPGKQHDSPASPHALGSGEIDPRDILSELELTIAKRVVAGLSSKEIADELKLTSRSVDKHRANIMEKLGVRQAAGLVRLCVLSGIT